MRITLKDGELPFDVTVLRAARASRIVAFAVGAGGNPERHLPLLSSLADRGCTVVAPHCERLMAPRPTEDELRLRASRLRLALDFAAEPDLMTVGIGHSLGATVLIALAGGNIWMGPGRQLHLPTGQRIGRLVLLAPATGFFRAPGALAAFCTPVQAWAGKKDDITPLAQVQFLEQVIGNRVRLDLRIVDDAGHFSFMNTLPPKISDPMPDREAFLAKLADEIFSFITG